MLLTYFSYSTLWWDLLVPRWYFYMSKKSEKVLPSFGAFRICCQVEVKFPHTACHTLGPNCFKIRILNTLPEWVGINVRLRYSRVFLKREKTLYRPDTIVSSTKQSGYSSVVHCAALAAGTVERSFKLFSTNSIDSVSSIYTGAAYYPLFIAKC